MQIKRMNWFSQRPLYKQMEVWRQNHRARIAEFQSASQMAVNSFASAQYNYFTGMATLAGQASLSRVQDEIKAATKELPVNKLV